MERRWYVRYPETMKERGEANQEKMSYDVMHSFLRRSKKWER
jgi:hypothetical protein